VITDAIRDDNVLKFSVEYVGRYKEKEGSNTYIDTDVEAIDTQELLKARNVLKKLQIILSLNMVEKHITVLSMQCFV
jgi:type I restriction enzyme R subunit